MSLDTALFLVDRGGVNHHVTGANAYTVMQPGDRVLVQRGADIFQTWHSKPPATETPYMTRRFTYTREFDVAQDKYLHPKGDGVINFGHDFGTAGDFPADEWVNVRNRDAAFNDLDGNPFELRDSTQTQENDLVRITHEGGDFECWYALEDPADWMKFTIQRVDAGRNNTNLSPIKGTKPNVDDGAVLLMEFYRDPLPFDTIADDDLLLAWENNQTKHVTGATFKPLFIPPLPPLGEWNWKGHSTSTALYQMCDNGNQRYSFFKSDWGNLYFDHVDRDGQTAMHTKFQQSVDNGDEVWFKVNNHPAVRWTDDMNANYTPYYCSFSIGYYDTALTTEQGIIRWYDQNPDAA